MLAGWSIGRPALLIRDRMTTFSARYKFEAPLHMIRHLKILAVSMLALVPSGPVFSEGLAGAYLAARQASIESDYEAAARYFTMALAQDPSNPVLLDSAVATYLGLGELESALPIARKMRADGLESQAGFMVLIANNIAAGDFGAVLNDYKDGHRIGPLVDGLVQSWALVGKGQMTEALTGFDEVTQIRGTRAFGLYHKALALALVGDYEGADKILSGEANGPLRATRSGVIAHIEILSQLERNSDALELLDLIFEGNTEPGIAEMRAALETGETLPFTQVSSAQDGITEVFFTVASVLSSEASPAYTLLYSRIAGFLSPDHEEALLLTASILERLERYELATEVYDQVPRDSFVYHIAELGRSEALRNSGKPDAAIEVLMQLAESHSKLPIVHSTLGDTLRGLQRYAEATEAYDRAIALFEEPERDQWIAFYSRGITRERENRWDESEADFRKALELNPGQPHVLNYLGYSLVEQKIKLDEALAMIEEAVAARPDDGYIVDSLAWALFRLGRYEEAIVHMERAVELAPVDPIVSDHLGDVLWAVGRTRESEFQWRRAMSFNPEEKDAARILRKLEIGLDAVLLEEGSEALFVANDD